MAPGGGDREWRTTKPSSSASGEGDGRGPGKLTLVQQLSVPQQPRLGGLGPTTRDVQASASHGTSGVGSDLPHLDTIQRLFGRHDISQVKAHTDEAAREGATAMGAEAFAMGDQVAFAGAPDLHTAAHEAAHVVQQRGGVQLKGGVGQAGDEYEQHADRVADAVVAGRSAEPILDAMLVGGGGSHAAPVQRKPANDQLTWRNAVIEGERRIQDVIRVAQQEKKARIQIELFIEPDFVGVDQHSASGTAPPGKDPDGAAIHKAAVTAVRDVAEQPPRSRRTMTVVLDRTPNGWERSRFALTGETKAVTDTGPVSVATGHSEVTNILQLAQAAHHGKVRMDVAFSSAGIRILSWQSSGAAVDVASQPSTERLTRSFEALASLAGSRTLVYELSQRLGQQGWEPEGMKLLGEVKSPDADDDGDNGNEGVQVTDPDDAEAIVADIKSKRRLVLSVAAELIAEQDPSRLHNLVFSLGPLLLVGMVRVGRVVRLGRRWRPRLITEEVCRVGCENVARQISRHVGGEIIRIKPKGAPALGAFRGKNWAWGHHEVVIREGRVYDLTTGHQGLEIAEYKKLWEHPDAIDFGF